jgi:hypothetical protein
MSGNKLYRLAIATALALPSLGAQAIVFGPGLNDIELINRENNYRTTDNCTAFGGCLAATADDPAGFQRVDPTVANNIRSAEDNSIANGGDGQGDYFAGVFASRAVTNQGTTTIPGLGTVWNEDNVSAGGIDTFSGYFAQEVKQIQLDVDGTSDRILLGTPTTDPFGILGAGEIARAYVDNAGLANTQYQLDGLLLTVNASIASITDGAFWGSFGIGADVLGAGVDNDGYIYSLIEVGVPGTDLVGDFFAHWDVVLEGAAYNAGNLTPINDPAELLKSGALLGDPLTTAINNLAGVCVAIANVYACNDVVGNGQLSANQSLSPWVFASEDPLQLHRTVPEPGSLALLGAVLAGVGFFRRNVRSRKA